VKSPGKRFSPRNLIGPMLLLLVAAGCARPAGPCPSQPFGDLSRADEYAAERRLPFRFPLDALGDEDVETTANFSTGGEGPAGEYHAAEDYLRPAGTPVYAMADGEISFSGRMGGYGWLIIIDHPQANLYSLYGHLSPSRWRLRSGTVGKGELVAYLGDPDENGGSAKHPLRSHLHLGVRAGQRADYSGLGEARWQAGWIKPCPTDMGWLRPSAVINGQAIPSGGFEPPSVGFLTIWGIELLFAGVYLLGGASVLIFATRQGKPILMILAGAVYLAAAFVLRTKGAKLGNLLFAMSALILAIGITRAIRRFKGVSRSRS
jgi:murein DD-endopeptidase MepM/ murein hydrolase activator NlpD